MPRILARAIMFSVIALGALYAMAVAHQHFGGNGIGACLVLFAYGVTLLEWLHRK